MPHKMAQLLRQALNGTRGALSAALSTAAFPSSPAAVMEARPLSCLLSLRGFHGHSTSYQMPDISKPPSDGTPAASSGLGSGAGLAPPPPWTPTRELVKRNFLPRRMGHLLKVLEKEKEEEALASKKLPNFGPGDFLELKLTVPENKRRTTVFKGICIARRNRGWRTSFTIRNFVGNSGGIERTFPLYSPHLQEVKVLNIPGRKKYHRSKLYFLRDVQPKEYRVV